MDKLLIASYKNYCGEDHCFFSTCPVNALMFNMTAHLTNKDPILIYGDYEILKELAK